MSGKKGAFGYHKLWRRIILCLLSILPKERRTAIQRWLLGRHEYRKLRSADYVIVSPPKSGRTWLRVMLSRFFQTEYSLQFDQEQVRLIGFKNFQKLNPNIPKIFFTHDHYIKHYTRSGSKKTKFYKKKVILLIRDPRDSAVSSYFQSKYRSNKSKKDLIEIDVSDPSVSLEDFVAHVVPKRIEFLNEWWAEMANVPELLIIRYEDLHKEPEYWVKRLIAFMGFDASDQQIADTVAYASFGNLKKLEHDRAFGKNDHRLTARDRSNPDSYKVRRAKVGGYKDYVSAELASRLDRLVADHLSPFFGYGRDGAAARPAPAPESKRA